MTPASHTTRGKMRRPYMPVSVQRDAALIALGLDPADVEWHHEPPLALRPFDEASETYTPDANDPRHIIPMATQAHKARTPKDITAAAKTARVTKREQEFRDRLLRKADGDTRSVRKRHWPSRPFQSRKPFNKPAERRT